MYYYVSVFAFISCSVVHGKSCWQASCCCCFFWRSWFLWNWYIKPDLLCGFGRCLNKSHSSQLARLIIRKRWGNTLPIYLCLKATRTYPMAASEKCCHDTVGYNRVNKSHRFYISIFHVYFAFAFISINMILEINIISFNFNRVSIHDFNVVNEFA